MKIINNILKFLSLLIIFITYGCGADMNKQEVLPEDFFYNSGIDSTSEFKVFFEDLKTQIALDNKNKVAAKISYPITVKIKKSESLNIKNEDEFIKNYDLVVNDTVREAIRSQNFNQIRRYSNGVTIGRGILWISSIKLNESDSYEIKIFAINQGI